MTHAEIGTDYNAKERAEAGGNLQSLMFYYAALNRIAQLPIIKELSQWHMVDGMVKYKQAKIHDYGCAEGDGTALLQVMFPLSEVVGIDASPEAIALAKERWPTMKFRLGDTREPDEQVHVIYTSHTIEHFKDPGAIIDRLREMCQVLVIIFPPIIEGKDGGHTGAAITEEWLPKVLMKHDGYKMSFMTCRRAGEEALPEGNILLFMQGALAGKMIK